MKVTTNKPEFTPVSITITFETQEELDKFGCLCNSSAITENVCLPHYSNLEKLGADVDGGVDRLLRAIKRHPSMKNV